METNEKEVVGMVQEMTPGQVNTQIEFGLTLKKWRLRNGLTQSSAADLFGCSRHTIMRAESGRRITWEQLYKLAVKLGQAMAEEVKTNN